MFAARHNVALAAVVTFPLLGASAAQAAPITYDFTVTGTSGPLNGTAAHGTFSYDSSSIVPRGANQATGLLTSLSFSWNGISYDQTTANTGDLRFDVSGNLTQAQFGSNCSSFGCSLIFGSNSWFGITGSFFSYSTPTGLGSGSFTIAPAVVATPEPTTLALLGLGCVLVGAARRGRRDPDPRGEDRW